jgi:hypothetical protein
MVSLDTFRNTSDKILLSLDSMASKNDINTLLSDLMELTDSFEIIPQFFSSTLQQIFDSLSNVLTIEKFNSLTQLNIVEVLSPLINNILSRVHPTLNEILSSHASNSILLSNLSLSTSSLQQNLMDDDGFIPLLTHNLDFIL